MTKPTPTKTVLFDMPEEMLANDGTVKERPLFYGRHKIPPTKGDTKLNVKVSYNKVNGSFYMQHPQIVSRERCSPRKVP